MATFPGYKTWGKNRVRQNTFCVTSQKVRYSFWQSFSTSHSLLSCNTFAEKSINSLMRGPLYITSYFSCTVFKFFSLSLTYDNWIIMCFVVNFFEFIQTLQRFLYLINQDINVSAQNCEVLRHCFLNKLSVPLSFSPS